MTDQPVARRIAGAIALLGFLSACSPQASTAADGASRPTESPAATATLAQAGPARGAAPAAAAAPQSLPDFVHVVEEYGPAVVNVQVIEKVQPSENAPGGMSPNDPFYDFFRRFGIPNPRGGGQGGGQPAIPQRGEGSGFIVSPDGYILTNAHVVADTSEVTVRLTDRREFTAKVVGVDTRSDIAVLKIDAKNLPTVKIGDPNKLKPGQWVLAIGSPFGLENSATAGIVSATARALPSDNYVPFIQTDVAVNPGNSGGPLLNLNGEVVGINSQIYSRSGGYMGLSFAIPIDVAVNVENQLIKTGKVTRGRIGVAIQEVNAQLADSFGLERPKGALVSSVETGGPADKAGVKAGDVILKVDGKDIDRSAQVPSIIAAIKPGTTTDLEVWRDRAEKRISVKVVALQDEGQKTASRGSDEATPSDRLGLAVRPLEPQERRQVKTDGALVVEEVEGPAATAGVQPGDIILAVNSSSVKTLADFEGAVKKSGKTVALLIQRENAQIFIPIHIG
jgi:serine protease Do